MGKNGFTSKKSSVFIFIIIVILVIFFSVWGFLGFEIFGYKFMNFNESIKKGLDLQGGVSVLQEIVDEEVTKDTLQRTRELLSLRVNKFGLSEPVVAIEGDNRIRIDLAGVFDSDDIVKTLTSTGELTFKDENGNVLLTGNDVKDATAVLTNEGKAIIQLKFTPEGTQKFAEATKNNLNKTIEISMDDQVLTKPVVNTEITEGEAVIEGSRSFEEANKVASIIQSGALPVTLKTISVSTVGPTLGAEAIPNTVKAGIIGFIFIFIIMFIRYRFPGVIATMSLFIYMLLFLFIFSLIQAVLTLPGIAGILLTLGMAIDANILIFERIREELIKGKSVKIAIRIGFDKAMSSILDSNITTIIAGLVLYFIGTGGVKGFATTLLIGTVLSMFSSIVITKFMIKLIYNIGLRSKASYGLTKSIEQKSGGAIKDEYSEEI
ncbi:protein translocase subunit SecD [Candidatus Arthromitus sp. SFB-turkey]|uniref:protein translocase subunit SecD n=1 Tax=Candidatus Arthromitus sp. SFB-turkey TaxID=1840217 RepID=UPI0007F419A8|nr:protein translocase subunit SecD [Candidatus Arthromitus sp. SFB-turkey]OAT89067.1 preprotein translocase subunit SecD [Candidatus Arthromitus sp. SFB-turkey]HJD00601.1 protein translocase subunit SecD [Candidatus Dwaynia gallinarum]